MANTTKYHADINSIYVVLTVIYTLSLSTNLIVYQPVFTQAESVRYPGKRFFKELSDDVFAYVSIGVEHKTLTEGLRRFVAGGYPTMIQMESWRLVLSCSPQSFLCKLSRSSH